MKVAKIFLLINLCLLSGFISTQAQVKTALKLDESQMSSFGKALFCDKDKNYCGLAQTEKEKSTALDNELIYAKVRRAGADFYLLVDTNQNKKLTDEKKVLLKNESKVIVRIKRKLENGKTLYLPFEIRHGKDEIKNQIVDDFVMSAHYTVAGNLVYKNCSTKISLSDIDFDGNFDLSEGEFSTNFKIDRNNDGKFWGKGEFYKSSDIIEFCGQNFLVSSMSNSELILSPTYLELAKIGEIVPKFSFVLLNGETVTSEKLQGKAYILDFWASWCVVCIKNFPELVALEKEYPNELVVFSINVDPPEKKDLANKIVNENQVFDFSSIRGLGVSDPLWLSLSAASPNFRNIPLYLLIDKNGIVRFADFGGNNLTDLKNSTDKLLKKVEN